MTFRGFFFPPMTNKVKMAQAVCLRNHSFSLGPTVQPTLHGTPENLHELQNGSFPKEFTDRWFVSEYLHFLRIAPFSFFVVHCTIYVPQNMPMAQSLSLLLQGILVRHLKKYLHLTNIVVILQYKHQGMHWYVVRRLLLCLSHPEFK